MLETAGFRVDYRATEPFAQTFVCTAVDVPFAHRLPDEVEAPGAWRRRSRRPESHVPS